MKKIVLILITLSMVCCQKQESKTVIPKKTKSSESKIKSKPNPEAKIYPLLMDTLKIGNKKFIVIQNDPRDDRNMNLSILDEKKDTVYVHDGFATNGFELEDFDHNGIPDIRLFQITNVDGISDLIFYDTNDKTFKPVQDFGNFPQPTKMKNTKYWFSYHRNGCSDLNWGSELFKIENFKAIKIGEIEGIGCEDEKQTGIFAYLVKGNTRNRIYAEKRKPGYYNDKWDFITTYWNKNFTKFE
ncbi:MAG: hypothetical protein QM710_13920 [Flavobacterium sp.]